MRKFSKNVVTHRSTKQIPFLLDFLKTLLIVVIIGLAIIGVYAILKEETQEFLFDDFTLFMENIASKLGL